MFQRNLYPCSQCKRDRIRWHKLENHFVGQQRTFLRKNNLEIPNRIFYKLNCSFRFVSKVLPDRNSSFSWIYSLPSINKQSINQQLPRWAKIPFWGEDQIEGDRCPIEPIRKILITAMGRSGSSFVGQILTTMVSQSYYAFEPLWDSGGNITEGTFK